MLTSIFTTLGSASKSNSVDMVEHPEHGEDDIHGPAASSFNPHPYSAIQLPFCHSATIPPLPSRHFTITKSCHSLLFGCHCAIHHLPINTPIETIGHTFMSMSVYTCVCKLTFTEQNYFSQHQHSCAHTKKHLLSAISSFKEFASRRKKLRTSSNEDAPVRAIDSSIPSSNFPALRPPSGELLQQPRVAGSPPNSPLASATEVVPPDCEIGEIDGEDLSLAQCRPRRQNRQLPKRFRDILPQPPPTVPLDVRE
ncbi:uncharacterized protein HD556DRAFT_1449008 [Suillus plorans]|uniref:Uncharacterized protein n=1 Tax=Suillus plorans TaxID=116603 RepID=A0A9P7DCU1_9AGAM|nr:uncharacterized protein HD556DRAFT_1449008 [Suillus plorans]KAG1787211.1 hypothetical protein HD556DRAFT_1449008 [Suillus plorans]